jgi:hypothetical protein
MFLKHGAKNPNEIQRVAPTGFEPVFQSRSLNVLREPFPPPSDGGRSSPLLVPAAGSDPAAVDGMVGADELQERRPALGVLVEGALEGRNHL